MSFIQATLSCGFFTGIFVGSLYIWNKRNYLLKHRSPALSSPWRQHKNREEMEEVELDRDHPVTIKRRFLSVLFASTLSIIYLNLFWSYKMNQTSPDQQVIQLSE